MSKKLTAALARRPDGRLIPDGTELDWKPVRSGKHYCSPACGGGQYCLYVDYLKASRAAKKLAQELSVGQVKFEPHVWENLGWYYSVSLKLAEDADIEIHAHDASATEAVSYTVFIQTDPQIVESGADVLATLRKAIQRHRKHALRAASVSQRLTRLQLPVFIKL